MDKLKVDEYLTVIPNDGLIIRKRTCGRAKAGSNAENNHGVTSCGNNYKTFGFMGKKHYVHRFIYEYVNGDIPEGFFVDHADGNTWNNRIENLRLCNRVESQRNRGCYKNNTSGVKGVDWHKASGKWRASITSKGKYKQLGMFSSFEDAAKFATEARKNIFGDFYREVKDEN